MTNAARVEHAIATANPDLVLNATAYNMVDVAEREPEAAFAGNALAVEAWRWLADRPMRDSFISRQITFSTVRSDAPMWRRTRHIHWARMRVSKLAGELYAQAYLNDPLIIRTSGVFGPGGLQTARGNFVETMLRLANSGQPIRVVEDFVASPTYAPELALANGGNGGQKLQRRLSRRAADPHLVVRLREVDFRSGRHHARVEADDGARASYTGAPSQVLGSFECEKWSDAA